MTLNPKTGNLVKQKYLVVDLGGDTFRVPVKIIAESRAAYYAKVDADAGEGTFEDRYKEELEYSLSDNSELLDWASNNMNWSDLSGYAVKMRKDKRPADLQKEWTNADKEIIED